MIPISRVIWCVVIALSAATHFAAAVVLSEREDYQPAGSVEDRVALRESAFQQFVTDTLQPQAMVMSPVKPAANLSVSPTAATQQNTPEPIVSDTAAQKTQQIPVQSSIPKKTLLASEATPENLTVLSLANEASTISQALVTPSVTVVKAPLPARNTQTTKHTTAVNTVVNTDIRSPVTDRAIKTHKVKTITTSAVPILSNATPLPPEAAQNTTPVTEQSKSIQPTTQKTIIDSSNDTDRNASSNKNDNGENDLRQMAAIAGNAAALAYPDKVRQKIIRMGKPMGNLSRPAEIYFSIDAAGKLVEAKIKRSSGNRSFDRTALHIVRKASPFPPPPPGARQEFSIQFKSY